jgi:ScaI restriction endonuclease
VSTLGSRQHQIGKDIFPPPQVLGFLLQEFIALALKEKYPEVWRGEVSKIDKDLVYVPDDYFSIEIKSSSQRGIYGNRSYAQKSDSTKPKKSKSGYYLAINFEGFCGIEKSRARDNNQLSGVNIHCVRCLHFAPFSLNPSTRT